MRRRRQRRTTRMCCWRRITRIRTRYVLARAGCGGRGGSKAKKRTQGAKGDRRIFARTAKKRQSPFAVYASCIQTIDVGARGVGRELATGAGGGGGTGPRLMRAKLGMAII